MRRLLRSISLAALACLPLAGLHAAQAGDCRPRAIEKLRTAAPDGFAIYQRIKDKKFFSSWIKRRRVVMAFDSAMAAVFIGFGLKLAFDRAR